VNRGRRWLFRDRTATPANGIVRVTLDDRSQQSPGTARLKITGQKGDYPLHPSDAFVNFTIVLDDGAAGECVETDFTAADCRKGGLGSRVTCTR
jgi:hypothetical protein